jgi:hypothetical protein
MSRVQLSPVVLLLLGAGLTPVAAANRFYISNQGLYLGTTGNEVSVLAETDEDTYGLSVHLSFDDSNLGAPELR